MNFFSPHNILVTFYISCQQWHWGFCSTTSSSVRWQDTFPLQRGYFFLFCYCYMSSCLFFNKKVAPFSSSVFWTSRSSTGACEAIAWIYNILSMHSWGERIDHARNKGHCKTTCKTTFLWLRNFVETTFFKIEFLS